MRIVFMLLGTEALKVVYNNSIGTTLCYSPWTSIFKKIFLWDSSFKYAGRSIEIAAVANWLVIFKDLRIKILRST